MTMIFLNILQQRGKSSKTDDFAPLSVHLIEHQNRNSRINNIIQFCCFRRRKIDASMRPIGQIDITAKRASPICVVKTNASAEWHPIGNRSFILIASIWKFFASKHIRAFLIIQAINTCRRCPVRIAHIS